MGETPTRDRVGFGIRTIHSLTALSRDFPDLRYPVLDVLAAYVRSRPDDLGAEPLDNDISAIIEFLHPGFKER